MHEIQIVLVSLLVSVVVLGTIARLVHVPYPIVLVIGGLVLGLLLGPDDTVTLDPDLVLVIFLPPLLYSSAFFANLHDIRRGIRVVTVQAVGLVLVTMCAVAVVAHELIDGMSWPVAFVLGAIVSPTDALRRRRSCAACRCRGGWCRSSRARACSTTARPWSPTTRRSRRSAWLRVHGRRPATSR